MLQLLITLQNAAAAAAAVHLQRRPQESSVVLNVSLLQAWTWSWAKNHSMWTFPIIILYRMLKEELYHLK